MMETLIPTSFLCLCFGPWLNLPLHLLCIHALKATIQNVSGISSEEQMRNFKSVRRHGAYF